MRIAIVSLVTVTACSFLAVNKPPSPIPDPSTPHVQCTTSRVAPVLDAVGAGAGSVATVTLTTVAILAWRDENTDPLGRGVFLLGTLVSAAVAVPYWIAAIYGYRHTGRCRRFLAARDQWLRASGR